MCHGCNGPRVGSTRVTGAEAPSVARVARVSSPGAPGRHRPAGPGPVAGSQSVVVFQLARREDVRKQVIY